MESLDALVKRAEKFSLTDLEAATGLSRRTLFLIRRRDHKFGPRYDTVEKYKAGVRDLEKQIKGKGGR